MLQGDVAERQVGDTVGDIERAAVENVDRAQAVDPAEPGDRLAAALEEAGIEVAGVHHAKPSRERTRHPSDPGPDLDEHFACRVLAGEPEGLEVHRDLGIPRSDELGERLRVTGFAVEHPAGGLDDVVGALLSVGELPGHLPGEELRAAGHRASVAEAWAS